MSNSWKGFRGKWLKRVEKVLWKYDDDRATNEFFDCAVKYFQTNVIHEKEISNTTCIKSERVHMLPRKDLLKWKSKYKWRISQLIQG